MLAYVFNVGSSYREDIENFSTMTTIIISSQSLYKI